MRSRPKVKLLLSPAVVVPGTHLRAESVLTSKSETPIEFVSMLLTCKVSAGVGAGKSRVEHTSLLHQREWRSPAVTLVPGERRYQVSFDLPESLPPTYLGPDASILYLFRVHVSIPWWPDRVETFTIDVVAPESPAPPPARPQAFATSSQGPRGTTPFMEIALATTELTVDDVLTGSVSLQNLRGKRIKGVDVSIIEVETVTKPSYDVREARRFTARVFDGAPREGEAIPFGVHLPATATPTFRAGIISVSTHLEVRAIVSWGEDIVLRPPLSVAAKASAPRAERGWVAPVGRERRALVWQRAAQRTGLNTDPNAERMYVTQGPVSVDIRTEQRDADFWLVAKLVWPSLGLDLDIHERKWTDNLALDVVKSGYPEADTRFAAHAREHAQARSVVTGDLMLALMRFEEAKLDDTSATLSTPGTTHTTEAVEAFVTSVLAAAGAVTAAAARVPAPLLLAPQLAAWRAFADRLRGRLELGRMHIHDGSIGVDAVSVGTEWTRNGALIGTGLRVAIDPPLETPPSSLDDPAVSPAAREVWRDLVTRAHAVRVEHDAVHVQLEGRVADPNEMMPLLELAVALRRALAGIQGAGPFR